MQQILHLSAYFLWTSEDNINLSYGNVESINNFLISSLFHMLEKGKG